MKYKLTANTIIRKGIILYQIEALQSFRKVKRGDYGGYIEKESNLSQEGNCWVHNVALVYNDANISGNAQITDNAEIFGNAQILDNAYIGISSKVYGNAVVRNNGVVHCSGVVYDNAEVCDDAKVSDGGKLYGNAKASGKMVVMYNWPAPLTNLNDNQIPEFIDLLPKGVTYIRYNNKDYHIDPLTGAVS